MSEPETVPREGSEAGPERRILHCDLDCFYAAVHVKDDPSLAGLPVVVGGSPTGRGVVAAASYEARAFGIHSAMPAARAVRLCPQAVFLKTDFARYREESAAVFDVFRALRPGPPVIQQVSIDEAYLDVTEVWPEWGSATAVAREIRKRVKEERGLTISVGVGPNKLIAKIASDFDKPDGLTVVHPHRVSEFLAPLPVRSLRGVGPRTEESLLKMGIRTVADLRLRTADDLAARFGSYGRRLYEFARGIDHRPVTTHRERKSLGHENTYRQDLRRLEEMDAEIDRLSSAVAQGLEGKGFSAHTFTLKVRYDDFTTITRARSLPAPTRDGGTIARIARELLREKTDAATRPVRLLGVTASSLTDGTVPEQLWLFEPWRFEGPSGVGE
jgi:DNA polymerase IV